MKEFINDILRIPKNEYFDIISHFNTKTGWTDEDGYGSSKYSYSKSISKKYSLLFRIRNYRADLVDDVLEFPVIDCQIMLQKGFSAGHVSDNGCQDIRKLFEIETSDLIYNLRVKPE